MLLGVLFCKSDILSGLFIEDFGEEIWVVAVDFNFKLDGFVIELVVEFEERLPLLLLMSTHGHESVQFLLLRESILVQKINFLPHGTLGK
jgi:hypothetical protein